MCGRTDGLCFCSSCCFCAVWQYAYACSPFCADGLAGEGLARLRMKQSGAMLWGAKQRQCCAICRLFRKRIRLPFALRCSAAVWMHKGLCVCARQSFYWRQGLRKTKLRVCFRLGGLMRNPSCCLTADGKSPWITRKMPFLPMRCFRIRA